ncbi:hypothetical protein [Aquisphaera insulae]|uniref:hypothetical protein n=1 Tax=Aquisphaera insulae TaxID=2712864 RepID=UPI0013E9C041|nr:hypothetical protein [Aquisphaera insulae]
MSSPRTWSQRFATKGIKLTPLELAAVEAAYENLRQKEIDRRGKIDKFVGSAFDNLEKNSVGDSKDGAKFALDPDAFQIIRYHDTAKQGMQWERFGIQRKGNRLQIFVRQNMYGDRPVNLGKDTPEVAAYLNELWDKEIPVIALLGAARLNIKQGMQMLETVNQLVETLGSVAYMTGGYRGESGNCYGVTRAGFDVPKRMRKPTLLIMCRAGIGDAHQSADAMSYYGEQWGDDTPALAAASDAAIFIRNIPNGKVYGSWTDVEIANFLELKKKLVILDPTMPTGTEDYFGKEIEVFSTAVEVAVFLKRCLPTAKELSERTRLNVTKSKMVCGKVPKTTPVDDYMAVRLAFGPMKAMWVLQTDKGREPFINAGLKFSTQKWSGGRDLVLDGYWKDILLLQHLGKLPEDGLTADLAKAYKSYRDALERQFGDPNSDNMNGDWEWERMHHSDIPGFWFMFTGEHRSPVIQALLDLPGDAYSRALDAIQAREGDMKLPKET